jgi:cytochrome c oxidase subunit 3
MLFILLTTSLVARRGAGKFDPLTGEITSKWIPVSLPVKILFINTAVLLLSCLLVEIARRAARLESILVPLSTIPGVRAIRQTSLMWAMATLLAGLGFLFGQYRVWQQLYVNGAFLSSRSASTFVFLLMGTHTLHLVAGLAVLLYACVASGPRFSLEWRCITIDVIA